MHAGFKKNPTGMIFSKGKKFFLQGFDSDRQVFYRKLRYPIGLKHPMGILFKFYQNFCRNFNNYLKYPTGKCLSYGKRYLPLGNIFKR